MADYLAAKAFMAQNQSVLTTKDAERIGLKRMQLKRLVQAGELEQVERGVYIDAAVFGDDLFNFQYRFKRGIYSNETALYLHHLTDRTPNSYTMTFPAGYHPAKLSTYPIQARFQVVHLYKLGITDVQTLNGLTVKAYNIERTLCDLLRGSKPAEDEVILHAFRTYLRQPDRQLNQLFSYAKKLRVEKKLRPYVEILL